VGRATLGPWLCAAVLSIKAGAIAPLCGSSLLSSRNLFQAACVFQFVVAFVVALCLFNL
jgi:hypothetical protein